MPKLIKLIVSLQMSLDMWIVCLDKYSWWLFIYLLCAKLFLTSPGAWRAYRWNIYIQLHFSNVWELDHFGLTTFCSDKVFSLSPLKRFWSATIPTFLDMNEKSWIVRWPIQKYLLQLNDPKQVQDAPFIIILQNHLWENIVCNFHYNAWLRVVNEAVLSFVCKVVS